MKIEDRGYVLIDVPGVDRIVIEPDPSQQKGAIVLFFRDGQPQRYGLSELAQFSQAVEHAVRLADVVANSVREAQRPDALQ